MTFWDSMVMDRYILAMIPVWVTYKRSDSSVAINNMQFKAQCIVAQGSLL